MKLQILIPQYDEGEEVVRNLLDSVKMQQGIDLSQVGAIIVNDGHPESALSQSFLKSYPFEIQYHMEAHRGVSGTRNSCLDHATADYVMFCDADDMFWSLVGLNIMFAEMDKGFDALITKFYEELHRDGKMWFVERSNDRTFVHGKFYRRQYLVDRNIRFNDSLTVHEDSYFNVLAATLSDDPDGVRYSDVPVYLWKWRDSSVCRHDPLYMQKTYRNYLDSVTALLDELISRGKPQLANQFVCQTMFDTYYLMNKPEWLEQENQTYRRDTELRFRDFHHRFGEIFDHMESGYKMTISNQVRSAKVREGMLMETLTFPQWLKEIEGLEKDGEKNEGKKEKVEKVEKVDAKPRRKSPRKPRAKKAGAGENG